MPFTGATEDRLAIRELIDAYADAVNLVDPQAWGACWADDAVWAMPDYPEIGEIHGRAAIVEAWIGAMSQYPGVIFIASSGSIEIEGDRALVRSFTSEVYDQSGVTHRDRGRYEDVVVKRDGRWLFARRQFKNIHRAQTPIGSAT